MASLGIMEAVDFTLSWDEIISLSEVLEFESLYARWKYVPPKNLDFFPLYVGFKILRMLKGLLRKRI